MNEQDIIDMYVNQDVSTYIIAKKYNTYPNKIRRILLKNGVQLDDRSKAQKKALEAGRSIHPTQGKQRSEETKIKISDGVHKNWDGISEETRKMRVDKAREQWNNMTVQQQEDLRKAAAEAVRQTAKEGSQMERFLNSELPKHGWDVIFHKTGLIQNSNLELDLFIPSLNTVIEIDGPSHFFPIWGKTDVERQALLQRNIQSDAQKSGLLLANGFVIIRIKHLTKSLSLKHKRDVLAKVLELLRDIHNNFPEKGDRYIEVEIK